MTGTYGETTDTYVDKTNSAFNTRKYSKQIGSTGNLTAFGTSLSSIGIRVYY